MSTNTNLIFLHLLKNAGVTCFLQNSPKNYYKNDNNISSKNINEINSLNQLEKFVNESNICPLKNKASTTVFGDGNIRSKIMLIGEAPVAEEDKIGKPFVGAAGKLLNSMLSAINLSRDKVYITNVVPWRPPNNRTPNTEEILQCLPFVQKHIEIINPLILILLGSTAAKAILGTNFGITKIRGKWYEYNNLHIKKSIPTMAIYHPSFLLRSPSFKKDTWKDLQEIQKKINSY